LGLRRENNYIKLCFLTPFGGRKMLENGSLGPIFGTFFLPFTYSRFFLFWTFWVIFLLNNALDERVEGVGVSLFWAKGG
jgi:hypothetical protein